MPARLYLMPIVGVGTYADPRRPKYLDSIIRPSGAPWGMMDYGNRPACLVGSNTDASTHTSLTSQSDVYAFPDDFQYSSSAIGGGGLNTLRDRLESFGVPAVWVQSSDTYRQVAHSVGCMFQYLQRINRIMGNVDPFTGSVTLNTAFQDLPQPTQAAMLEAADSFGWNRTQIVPNSSVRFILKYLSDQWGEVPLEVGGISF